MLLPLLLVIQDPCIKKLQEVTTLVLADRGPQVQCLTGKGETVVPELLALLKEGSDGARLGAAEALGNIAVKNPKKGIGFGPATLPGVIDGLKGAMRDPHSMVRSTALGGLSNIVNLDAGSADAVLPAMVAALDDGSAEVRRSAANDLAELGPRFPAPVFAAFQGHKETDEFARERIYYGYQKLVDAGMSEALAPLVAGLGDEKPLAREGAARALGRLGSKAASAAGALEAAQNDPDKSVRSAVQWALKQVRKP